MQDLDNTSVGVVLVNYRQPELTAAAVRSLLKEPHLERMTVVVVDNDAEGPATESLRAACPGAVVLSAGRNLGFAGGNNLGIRYLLAHGAMRILLLNNDAEVVGNCIGELLAAADPDSIVTPKILYADPSEKIWYGGGHVSRWKGGFYHDTTPFLANQPREVAFASGCCLLVPAEVFRKVGLLNESYFLYYEDAEFCLRVKRAGFRIRYVPTAVVRHKVSASTGGERSPTALYYGTRNRLRLLRDEAFPRVASAFVIGTRLVRLLRPRYWKYTGSILRGLWDGVRGVAGSRETPFRPLVVNGVFVGKPGTGLERFATEILRALDDQVAPGEVTVLVPPSTDRTALKDLVNIRVRRLGFGRGILWEQLCLGIYARLHAVRLLNLCNTAPILRVGSVCIHDIFYKTRFGDYRTWRGRLSRAYHIFQYAWCARHAERIFTVSPYSAREIARVYGVPESRLTVLGNGWEHIRRLPSDETVFTRFPALKKGTYFLTLGSRAVNKNLKWVYASAAHHSEYTYVIVGAALKSSAQDDVPSLPNLILTGRLKDPALKSLLTHCRALLFPSLEEGFAIPPLEALALGRPVLAARTSCLPEIFGNAVHWIDLDAEGRSTEDNPERLLVPAVDPPDAVLKKWTWRNAARHLLGNRPSETQRRVQSP